jgi:protein O-mannosyl-transferase
MDKFSRVNRFYCEFIWLPFVLAVVPYIQTLSFSFAYDDLFKIQLEPKVYSLLGALQAFQEQLFPGNLYRPVLVFAFACLNILGDTNPFAFHLMNVMLHGVMATLIYLLFREILLPVQALFVACIFAVAPINIEAVANCSGLAELLTHAFGMGYLLLMRGLFRKEVYATKEKSCFGLAHLLLFAALLTKESGVVYPLLLLILQVFSGGVSRRILQTLFTGAFSVGVGYTVLRFRALGFTHALGGEIDFLDNPLVALPWYERAVSAFALLGKYIQLTLVPTSLSADYSFRVLPPLFLHFTWSAVFHLLIASVAIVLAITFKRREVRLGIVWFFASFVIISNVFFPIGTIFGERLAYLPCIGLFIVLSSLIHYPAVKKSFYCLLGPLFFMVTLAHTPVWRSNETLFSYQQQVSWESPRTRSNYAVILVEQGKLEEALEVIDQALLIYSPPIGALRRTRISIYVLQGREDLIAAEIDRLLEEEPEGVENLILAGSFAYNNGDLFKAEEFLRKANLEAPENPRALLGLYAVSLSSGDVKSAVYYQTKVKNLDGRRISDEDAKKIKKLDFYFAQHPHLVKPLPLPKKGHHAENSQGVKGGNN